MNIKFRYSEKKTNITIGSPAATDRCGGHSSHQLALNVAGVPILHRIIRQTSIYILQFPHKVELRLGDGSEDCRRGQRDQFLEIGLNPDYTAISQLEVSRAGNGRGYYPAGLFPLSHRVGEAPRRRSQFQFGSSPASLARATRVTSASPIESAQSAETGKLAASPTRRARCCKCAARESVGWPNEAPSNTDGMPAPSVEPAPQPLSRPAPPS